MTELADQPFEAPDGGPGPARQRRLLFFGLLAILTLANLVPIWACRFFPTTDGPSHLENAYILLHWFDGDRIFDQFYTLNLDPFPNWATHVFLALLMLVFPPLAAEKILLTGYVLAFVLSVGYLLRGVGRDRIFHTLLAFPLIHNVLLYMGFYNFILSLPFLFFVVGFWWRRRERPVAGRLLVTLNLFCIVFYFFHVVSLLLALASILGLAALHNGARIRRTLALAAGLAPSAGLPLYYVVSRGAATFGDPSPGDWKAFASLEVLVSHDPRSGHVGIALAVLFGVLIAYTVARRRTGAGRAAATARIVPRDGFLLLAIAFSLLYFLVPEGIAHGGHMSERMSLYPVVILLPWLAVPRRRPFKIAVGTIAAALAVVHPILPLPRLEKLDAGLADYTSGLALVKRNQTVLPVNLFTHAGTRRSPIRTYLHAVGHYTVLAGAIGLDNYEANTDHFPLRYREDRNPYAFIGRIEAATGQIWPAAYPLPVDHILIRIPQDRWWTLPDLEQRHPVMRWIVKHYRLVHRRRAVWLFERAAPDWPPG